MADDEQGAGEVDQLCFEQLERLEVEVVRRFVEDEDVGRLREQPRQQQPIAFTAGQRPDWRSGAFRCEEEVARGSRARACG